MDDTTTEAAADTGALETVEARAVAVREERQVAISGDGAASVLSMIAQLATNPAVNIETMRALMEMRREMAGEDARRLFTEAMHAAQAEIPPVARNGRIKLGKGEDKEIPFTTYEDVMAVLQPIMDRHGFSVTWDTAPRDGGGAEVIGTLTHRAGHSVTSRMFLPLDSGPARNANQSMGSTITYGRRYVIENLFNVVRKGVDKDGNVPIAADDPPGITEAQAMEIEALLLKTKTPRDSIFERFPHVSNLLQLTPVEHGRIVNSLHAKAKKMQAES